MESVDSCRLVNLDLTPTGSKRDLFAVIVDYVFTPKECQDLIGRADAVGWSAALLNVGGGEQILRTDVRNNSRCIIDDSEFAEVIYQRIKTFIPQKFNGWECVGLNERLRILRYDPGERFKAHYDGSYDRPDGSEESFVTVQLYLNEGFKGGATTFLALGPDYKKVECVPKTGRVLLFQHHILHEGSELIEGRKYAVRTDVMYRKPSVA